MSYKSKKLKKTRFSRLSEVGRQVKIVLLKIASKFIRRKEIVVLQKTKILMERLRLIAKGVRPNNKKIDAWADGYIEQCVLADKPVVLLTQWCMSKDLEARYRDQGKQFIPTVREQELAQKEFPRILALFDANGIRLSWWVTFNRSYLDSGRMAPYIEAAYKKMVGDLFAQAGLSGRIMLLDWEDDVLQGRQEPNACVLRNLRRMLPEDALRVVFNQHASWARNEAGLRQSDEELWRDVEFQIACEADEGRRLCDEDESPFEEGEFILVPLEAAERYAPTFLLLNPDFEQRIASILKPYPWRWKDGTA